MNSIAIIHIIFLKCSEDLPFLKCTGEMSQPSLYPYSLKSLGLIYFVKIRLPDFLCNEFLIKMYRLLQDYTFEICTLSKITNTCCNYNIFTSRSLFTIDKKVDTRAVYW